MKTQHEFTETLYETPVEWGDSGYPCLLTEDEAEEAAASCTEAFETQCTVSECIEYNLIRALNEDKAIYFGGWHSDSSKRNLRRWVCVVDSKHCFKSQHETIEIAVDWEIPEPTNLEELMDRMKAGEFWNTAPMKHGELDWSSLPTFGGDDPADTVGIWSWDEDSFLVGDNGANLEIVDRAEWKKFRQTKALRS